MSRPTNGVVWDGPRGEALIVLVLDVAEAEGVADALGSHDGGAVEIRELVAEARALEASREPSDVLPGGDRA